MAEAPVGNPLGRVDGAAAASGSADTDRPASEPSFDDRTALGTPAGLGPALAIDSGGDRPASRPGFAPPPPSAPGLRAAPPPSSPRVTVPPSGRLAAAAPPMPKPPERVPSSARVPVPQVPHLADLPPREGTIVGAPPAPLPPPPEPAVTRPPSGRAKSAGTLLFGAPAETQESESTSVGSAPITRRCTACGERYPADFVICPRDATPLTDEVQGYDDPLLGKLLGDTYQIVRIVGEGGMGRVYEARHLRLKERRFAVKVLHPDLARHPEMAARFLREAESASSIHHPNVVDVFDVHHLADGTPYMVGEFLDGEELADLVKRRGALDPRIAVSVAKQVSSALGAAHARGIVHRDMKPENVFVERASLEALEAGTSATLSVKVLDFGISKAGGERTKMTRTGMIMGTPSYMAPEQARGHDVDHRADVYAVGAVLYYVLTGHKPFDNEDPTATLSMVLTQEPVRLRELDPRIPEALELVVQRAMSKDLRDRYATMVDLENALASFEESVRLPTGAVRSSPPSADLALSPGAANALDVAKVILGAQSTPPPAQSGSLARAARPMILVMSSVLAVWLVGGSTAALAGLVRILHDGEITGTECALLVFGCLFAAGTPAWLYVTHVKKFIWPNTARAVQLATDLKRTVIAVLVTYGALSVVLRIGSTVLLRSSRSLVSGWWDLLLLFVSLAAAATVGGARPLLANLRRRRR